MRGRRVRALRGTAAAAIAVLFASTAHTLSGGEAPPFWLVAAVTILATPVCIALVGRRRSVPRLAAAALVAQVALHTAFAAIGSAAPVAGADHHHDVMLMTGPITGAGATMTGGHAAAALVTILILAWGEQALAAIVRGIRRVLARAARPAVAHHPGAPVAAAPRIGATAPPFLTSVIRRGPPARLASAFSA